MPSDETHSTAALFHAAADRAAHCLNAIQERCVRPGELDIAKLARLRVPLNDERTDPAIVLRRLDEIDSPATIATAGPRFFGFVIGGSLPAAVAANWLATAWDQNAGLVTTSPIAAVLEEVSLGWLVDLLGLPSETGGGFVTCATTANLAGLAAARHSLLAREGMGCRGTGFVRCSTHHRHCRR